MEAAADWIKAIPSDDEMAQLSAILLLYARGKGGGAQEEELVKFAKFAVDALFDLRMLRMLMDGLLEVDATGDEPMWKPTAKGLAEGKAIYERLEREVSP